MPERKKHNGHRRVTLDELEQLSDKEVAEGIGAEEPEVRHLSEAEMQRRINRNMNKLNRRFWLLSGLLLTLNVAVLIAGYLWWQPKIDRAEAYQQTREMMGSARKAAGRGIDYAGRGVHAAEKRVSSLR